MPEKRQIANWQLQIDNYGILIILKDNLIEFFRNQCILGLSLKNGITSKISREQNLLMQEDFSGKLHSVLDRESFSHLGEFVL